MAKDTSRIMDEINRMKDPEKLKQYIAENAESMNYPNPIDYLIACTEAHGNPKKVLSTSKDIDQSFANKILACTRPFNRNHLLIFAFLGGLTLEETQNLLKYGKQSQLYAKDARDGVIIFGLSNHRSLYDVNTALEEMNLEMLGKHK